MRAYIEFQEVGKNTKSHTVYVRDNITRQSVIDFFGLEEPDVEWFKITIEMFK
jgi:hypothetical protein